MATFVTPLPCNVMLPGACTMTVLAEAFTEYEPLAEALLPSPWPVLP
jgi:hypothetical protein